MLFVGMSLYNTFLHVAGDPTSGHGGWLIVRRDIDHTQNSRADPSERPAYPSHAHPVALLCDSGDGTIIRLEVCVSSPASYSLVIIR